MNILTKMLALIILLATSVWPSESLFQINSDWTTDQGKSIKLSELSSKPTLMTLIYTHCATACPVAVHRLMKVNDLAIAKNVSVQIALVSMDTTRDTPKRLNEFRKEQKLSEKTWSLLSGKEEDVRALSIALGFSYQKVEDSEEILHSNRLVLLNEAGEIKHTFDGLNDSAEDIITQIQALEKK